MFIELFLIVYIILLIADAFIQPGLIDVARPYGKIERSISILSSLVMIFIFTYILSWGNYTTAFPTLAYYLLVYIIADNIYKIISATLGKASETITTSFEKAIVVEIADFVMAFLIIVCFFLH